MLSADTLQGNRQQLQYRIKNNVAYQQSYHQMPAENVQICFNMNWILKLSTSKSLLKCPSVAIFRRCKSRLRIWCCKEPICATKCSLQMCRNVRCSNEILPVVMQINEFISSYPYLSRYGLTHISCAVPSSIRYRWESIFRIWYVTRIGFN